MSLQTQIQTGAESGYWRLLAVYLLATALGVATIPVIRGMGPSVLTGSLVVILLFVLVLASLGALYALYKDCTTLATGGAWQPSWWIYLGSALLTPVVTYYIAKLLFGPNAAIIASVPVLIAATFVVCTWYLYQRHEHLKVP